MNRRRFLLGATAALAPVRAAWAADLSDQIVAQLRAQGYRNIAVRRTLLGRVQITGVSRKRRREIIVNPRSGEILRDYSELLDDDDDDAFGSQLFDPDDDDAGTSGPEGEDEGEDDGAEDRPENAAEDHAGQDGGGDEADDRDESDDDN